MNTTELDMQFQSLDDIFDEVSAANEARVELEAKQEAAKVESKKKTKETAKEPTLAEIENSPPGSALRVMRALARQVEELRECNLKWQIPIQPEMIGGELKYRYFNGPDVFGNRNARVFRINGDSLTVPYGQEAIVAQDWAYHIYSCLKHERETLDRTYEPGILYVGNDGRSKMVTTETLAEMGI